MCIVGKPAYCGVLHHVRIQTVENRTYIHADWRYAAPVEVVTRPGGLEVVFFHEKSEPHFRQVAPGVRYWEGQRWANGPMRVRALRLDPTRVRLVPALAAGASQGMGLTPVSRLSLLLGLMIADLALVITLTLPVIALGLITGVRFDSGPLGALAFIAMAGMWGLAYAGIPYAIALKTGNPAAVNMSFLIFLPFMFLTTVFLPKEALTGWMATVATYNPVTYLLSALRSLVSEGWNAAELAKGLLAIGAVWSVSLTLALTALRGRVRRR